MQNQRLPKFKRTGRGHPGVITNNDVWTLSFDWHAPQRLPYHERQNVLAWTAAVVPTNINGTLYEDHYVSFNAEPLTNPAVILIEYARTKDDGTVERYSAETITNSYPNTYVVHLCKRPLHTCYGFGMRRCRRLIQIACATGTERRSLAVRLIVVTASICSERWSSTMPTTSG